MSDPYKDYKLYRGKGGVVVELSPVNSRRWFYRFPPSKLWFEAKNKFTALLHASWRNRRSMQEMDWNPVKKS
jgi:hypothetical protein